jgi:hypothetical protein
MNFDWMSSLIGFLLGTITGASGKYFADRFTDQRRRTELKKQEKRRFIDIKKQMPEIIEEFKHDLLNKKLIGTKSGDTLLISPSHWRCIF